MVLIEVLEVFDLRINSYQMLCARTFPLFALVLFFVQLIPSSLPNLINSLLSNETPVSTIPPPPPPPLKPDPEGVEFLHAVVFSTPLSIYEQISCLIFRYTI